MHGCARCRYSGRGSCREGRWSSLSPEGRSMIVGRLRRIRGASLVLGTLMLAACVTTVPLSDRMPEPATLGEGEGLVIGSIVVTTPSGVATPEQQEMIDSLRQRKLTLTIRRYERWVSDEEGGEFGWSEDVGDKYVVALGTHAEQRFVLRAPEGKYAVRQLSDNHAGLFGDEPGCSIDNLAKFELHAGKTTYIGRLVVSAAFKSDDVLRKLKIWDTNAGPWKSIPERWLDMNLSVKDASQATLSAVDPSRGPSAIENELIRTGLSG